MSSIYPDKIDSLPYLISTSSDGYIKVWDCNELCNKDIKSEDISPVCSKDTRDRITALAVASPNLAGEVGSKRQREEYSDEDEENTIEAEGNEDDEEEEEETTETKPPPKKKRKAKKARVEITYDN